MLPTIASLALASALLLTGCSSSGGSASSTAPVSTAPTVPTASITPASVTFGATPAGSTAAAQVLTISNTGTQSLIITGITLGGANAANFAQTNTCATVAGGSSCTASVSFTPAAASTTYNAYLTITDNSGGTAGSNQTVNLTGSGAAPLPAPAVTLSTTAVVFPATAPGTSSSPIAVTLTNSGNASLTLSGITLGGASPASFAQTNTCGTTLAAGANCTLNITFSPAAGAATTYNASIAIADTATGSPQTITLQGSSIILTSVTRTLLAFPEADLSVTPLYALINSAKSSIDMTMYALEDATFLADLLADCKRGVTVRVILDQNLEKSGNTSAYNQLNAATNCSAVWANKAFQATHEKAFVIDNAQAAIMSLNLQTQYYSTTRDYALIENDAADIAAIEATFAADYAAGTPASGVAGASDFSYSPGGGDTNDLIWSPTTAQPAMLALINNATRTITLENEEMGAANIVTALENACQRGVTVKIAMVSSSSYATNFKALEAAGCGVHVYPNTTGAFYIHAKAVVADYGLATQAVYMGSINYSIASMTQNRELGLYITDPASVALLNSTMTSDYAGGTAY